MPKIERLTDEERTALEEIDEGTQALRIINQLTAALHAEQGQVRTLEQRYSDESERTGKLVRERYAARAEVTRLTAALEAAERKAESWERGHDYAWAEKAKAESRAEALQARVAELENRNGTIRGDWRDNMTKSSLRNLHPAVVMALDAWDNELRRAYATAKAHMAELEAENAELKARIAGPADVKQALTLTAANAKIDKLAAHMAELEALAVVSERQTRDMASSERHLQTRLDAAESELADLRGRVERALTVYSYFEIDLPAEVALRRIAEVLRGR